MNQERDELAAELHRLEQGKVDRPDPIPNEAQEGAAREMRQLYLALVGQNFTDPQATRIIGHTLGTLITQASENTDG